MFVDRKEEEVRRRRENIYVDFRFEWLGSLTDGSTHKKSSPYTPKHTNNFLMRYWGLFFIYYQINLTKERYIKEEEVGLFN